jgi:hypothetical protein
LRRLQENPQLGVEILAMLQMYQACMRDAAVRGEMVPTPIVCTYHAACEVIAKFEETK